MWSKGRCWGPEPKGETKGRREVGWFPGCFKGQIVMGRTLAKRAGEKSKGSWENYVAIPWKDLDRERQDGHSHSPLPATTKESSSSWAFRVEQEKC